MSLSVFEDRRQAGLTDVRELEALRLPHDAAHRVDLMHQAVEKDVAVGPAGQRVGFRQRSRDAGITVLSQRLREVFG